MNGRELTRADLSALEMREERLFALIEKFGNDYSPSQNTKVGMRVPIHFSL